MTGEPYDMDIEAWDLGTSGLSLAEEAAYLRLCHAMLDAGGSISGSPEFICGLFRCREAEATELIGALIRAGKIARVPLGRLTLGTCPSARMFRREAS